MSVTALPSLPVLPVRTCSMASPEPLPSKEASLEPGKGKQGAVPRYYLHHCYIWLGTVRVAPIIYACGLSSLPGLINLAEVLGAAPSSTVIVALLLLLVATLAVCAVVLGVRAWEYRYTWYEFDETEFSFYSGILSKHRTHVPYAKIQSVNERASLLQRLAGVCTVAIDTAGGANNKAVMVSYVERSAAEYLRRELFLRKQKEVGAVPSDSAHVAPGSVAQQDNVLDGAAAVLDDMRGVFAKGEVDTGLITCEYGLGNKELFLSALCGKSSFAVALLTVIAAVATVVSCFVEANLLNDQTAFFVTGMAKQHVVLACALVGLFVVGCLIAAWALCLLATCLSYGGFRARRRGSRIEVERGLITHVFSGIDVDRIQSVHIHQTLFQRLLKSCSVSYGRVGAASGEEASGGSSPQQEVKKLVVHPFLPLSEAQRLVAGLTPEYAVIPAASVKPPRVALRRALTRRAVLQGVGFWLAVCLLVVSLAISVASSFGSITVAQLHGLLTVAVVPGLVLCLVVMVAEAVGAVLWHRRSAFGFDTAGTTVVNGGYSTDTVIIPRKKMQYAAIRTNPLQRHAHVATVCLRTAAGVQGRTERLIDVPVTQAVSWLSWAEPGASGRV